MPPKLMVLVMITSLLHLFSIYLKVASSDSVKLKAAGQKAVENLGKLTAK